MPPHLYHISSGGPQTFKMDIQSPFTFTLNFLWSGILLLSTLPLRFLQVLHLDMAAGRLVSSFKRFSTISSTSQTLSNGSSPRSSTSHSTAPSSVAPDHTSLEDEDLSRDVLFSHPEKLPTQAELDQIADLTISGPDGEVRTFRSLYAVPEGEEGTAEGNKTTRTLIVFIRHFFCGVCTFASS